MIISNALPFMFIENEDTIAVFEFLVPGLKLSKRKIIGGKVLMKSTQSLQDNIIKVAKNNMNRVTATFDDETIKHELTTTGFDYQVSDDNEDNFGEGTSARSYDQINQNSEENEDLVTEKEQRWENLIQEWIEFGNCENQFENQKDEILLSSD
ncbi:10444_t:CDS:2 [Ambispora leptoticha]|uniref:10444_t:CDS:1 n=1 Tax=Ambispora leptoticha TaxID=144679 RepID=A0A9N9GCN9_9GLOM|nr:10444_t:CDS:2 [Ambispora leptoticha]